MIDSLTEYEMHLCSIQRVLNVVNDPTSSSPFTDKYIADEILI